MTELMLKIIKNGVGGVHIPKLDIVCINIPQKYIYEHPDGDYIRGVNRNTGERFIYGIEDYAIYLLNHEYNHVALTKAVSSDASRKYDNICDYVSELAETKM